MQFKLLIVLSSTGFRLDFAKHLAGEASQSGEGAGIVFVGNSLYDLLKRETKSVSGCEGVSLMAHEMSMAERGLSNDDLAGCVEIIDDDGLLELMISSERTICI